MPNNPNSQKAKLIARLQTYVPLYEWPLLDELAESGGPSEREAAIDECRDAAHDAIHHAIERMDLCAFVKGHVDEALLALKNAAPQGGTSSGVERPSNGEVGGSSPQPVPAAAASEAGAEPSYGLLVSIALRLDHGLFLRNEMLGETEEQHQRRIQVALADARKAWEECTGRGFYSPEREAEYANHLGLDKRSATDRREG